MSTQTSETTGTLTGTYDIDPTHSRLGFAAKHAMVATVRGAFKVYSGEVHLDEEHPENSWAKVEIDAASIDTRFKLRDRHLHTGQFLGVNRFPTISFAGTRVEDRGQDGIRVSGDLTIRGITRQIVLDATVEQRDVESARIAAHTILDRRDFKIGPKAMGLVVGNEVDVRIALALHAR